MFACREIFVVNSWFNYVFDLRYVVGPYEEVKNEDRPLNLDSPPPIRNRKGFPSQNENFSMYVVISNICQVYSRMMSSIKSQPRSPFCPHPYSCIFYSAQVGTLIKIFYCIYFFFNIHLYWRNINLIRNTCMIIFSVLQTWLQLLLSLVFNIVSEMLNLPGFL